MLVKYRISSVSMVKGRELAFVLVLSKLPPLVLFMLCCFYVCCGYFWGQINYVKCCFNEMLLRLILIWLMIYDMMMTSLLNEIFSLCHDNNGLEWCIICGLPYWCYIIITWCDAHLFCGLDYLRVLIFMLIHVLVVLVICEWMGVKDGLYLP